MWALFRVDIADPQIPTRTVFALLDRLPLEPGSVARAEALGGRQWFGWSINTEYLAGVGDRLTLTAKAAARQKAKLSEGELTPRPTAVAASRAPQTASFDDEAAMRRLLAGL